MLLPRALVVLKLLELRGLLRRLLKQMKRPAGALFVVLYLAMFAPAILHSVFSQKSPIQASPEMVLRWAPMFIGMLCVMSLLMPEMCVAFTFKPAETEVLFAGPYSRRHIVTYKLFGALFGGLFMAAIIFLASFAFTPTRLPMFVGLYLATVFSTMFNAAYAMLLQALSARAKYLGYAVAAAVFGLLGYAIYTAMDDLSNAAGDQYDPGLIAGMVLNHPIVHALYRPFVPFAHVMAADSGFAHWLLWTLTSLAMIAVLYVVVIVLDADYMETAMARSAQQYERLERFKRGQFISAGATRRGRRWSLPALPRMGGFGPVAWRQLTAAAHAWGNSLAGLFVLSIAGGMFLRRYDIDEDVRNHALPIAMSALVYLSIIFTNFVRFDFRSDLDLMDGLKTLPIAPRPLAAAQLVTPSLILAAVYVALALGAAIALDRPHILFVIALLALPFATLLTGVENLVFLIWPTRMAHQGNMDIQNVGRSFLAMMVKVLVLGTAAGLAAAAALVCHLALGSWALSYGAAAAVMAVEAALTVLPLASAFEKFDPSIDTPS